MSARDGATKVSSILKPASVRPRPIFLHFFDVHFLEERGAVSRSRRALNEMNLATRFAVMVGSRILVPASSFYESPIAATVLRPFLDSPFVSQRFALVGSGSSIEEFRFEKIPQYPVGSPQHAAYLAAEAHDIGWHRRQRSAGGDIARGWSAALPTAIKGLHKYCADRITQPVFERRWLEVEERLGNKAWIVPHVLELLDLGPAANIIVVNRLHDLINREYFTSYSQDPSAAMIQGLVVLSNPAGLPTQRPQDDIRYDVLQKACMDFGILQEIQEAPPDALSELSMDPRFITAFEQTQFEGYVPLTATPKLRVDLAIITALAIEREAVEHVFGLGIPYKVKDDNNLYRLVTIKIRDRPFNIVYGVTGQGNVRAAVLASNLLRSFDVRYAAFVGIAGGCPMPEKIERHVRLGDVVISSKVVEHDHFKLLADKSIEMRDDPQRASHAWISAAESLTKNATGFSDDWRTAVAPAMAALNEVDPNPNTDVLHDHDGEVLDHPEDARREGNRPIVHIGVIAAGDTLLKDPVVRDAIRDEFGALAIEMEAVGLRDAAYTNHIEFIVVRSIVDYCDAFKADGYRAKASVSAAAVLKLLFETLMAAEIEGSR
jgi:nucleoside phosphorylase